MVKSLLRLRCNPNFADQQNGYTPLALAVKVGNHAIFMELLRPEFNTNLNQQTEFGDTPLSLALFKGYFEAFQELVKAGAEVNYKIYGDSTPLVCALDKKDASRYVSVLLDGGASLSLEEKGVCENRTALMLACDKNDLASVSLLLEAAANVNVTDEMGCNIILRAVYFAHNCDIPQNLPLIRLLLWHGADAFMPASPYWRRGCSAVGYAESNNLVGTGSLFVNFAQANSRLTKAALLSREDDVANILRTQYNRLGSAGVLSLEDAELCRPTAEYMILRIAKGVLAERVGAIVTALGLQSVFTRGVSQVMLEYVGLEWEDVAVGSLEE
jgi:ankyrin repeat protein